MMMIKVWVDYKMNSYSLLRQEAADPLDGIADMHTGTNSGSQDESHTPAVF